MRDELRQRVLDLAPEQMRARYDVAEKRGAMLANELGHRVCVPRNPRPRPLAQRPPRGGVLAGQPRNRRGFDWARASRRAAGTWTAVTETHPGHPPGPARIIEPA